MPDPFARMTGSLLARLGGEAFLRGSEPCRVSIQHGVAVVGEYGEVSAYRSLATIDRSLNPAAGDALTAEGKSWVLDVKDSDDGYTVNYWLR